MTAWTYGAELEWPDVDTRTPLPPGWAWSATDYTIVNITGVANDPKRRLMVYGGELNTPPAATPAQLAERAAEVWDLLKPGHNYRSNLHIHVRAPRLANDLALLKRVATYTRTHLPPHIDTLDPLTPLLEGHTPNTPEYDAAHARLRHSRRSRHHFTPHRNHQARAAATTVEGFLAAEVPHTAHGTPQWHLASREAVNLRSLRKHGTIEFRCFAAPRTPDELQAAAEFTQAWLTHALENADPAPLVAAHRRRLPRQTPYNRTLETGWRATNLKTNTRAAVATHLQQRGLIGCV